MSSGLAVFSTQKDDLQVSFVPFFDGDEPFEVFFGLFNAVCGTQTPSECQAMDVCVYGECGHAKGL